MNLNQLAIHFKMSTFKLGYELFYAELIYQPYAGYAKPTQKALDEWVCEIKNGEYCWNAEELFWIKGE